MMTMLNIQHITGLSRCWLPAVFALVILGGSHVAANPAANWPAADLVASDHPAAGIDPGALAEVQSEIAASFPLTRSLLIVHNGDLVFEKYFSGATAKEANGVASVTKSVTAILFGVAMAQGKLAGPAMTVGYFFPQETTGLGDPRTKHITLRQLLTMTTGLRWHDRGELFWRHAHSRNRFRNMLAQPQLHEPGTVYNYSTAVSHLIGGVVAQATGQSLLEFGNANLFGPLGETVKRWGRDPMGHNTGGRGLMLTPRQMAKLGQLLLQNGKWGDQQIVPAAWLREATAMHVRFDDSAGYGYQFWVRELAGCASYYAIGRGGQFIVVVPEKDLVVVRTAKYLIQSRNAHKFMPQVEKLVAATPGRCIPGKLAPDKVRAIPATGPDDIIEANPLDIPGEVAAFFKTFENAMVGGDLENLMSLYSESFYFDGVTKTERRNRWRRILPTVTSFRFIPQRVEADNGGFHYEGQIKFNLGTFQAKGFLIRENDRLVLLGNPNGRPDPVALPDDLAVFIQSFAAALSRASKDQLPGYFSERYLSNGFSKAQLMAFLKPIVGRFGATKITASEFKAGEPVSELKGYLGLAGTGRIPMNYLFGHVVRENGKWLWYGNQLTE